ncbi:DUF4275 family protein [Parageobacillus thermoglucosidasius]|uniref:DUF4275 family protein n=1 Tax=Parageobacillus thermoglucosidasius TaxID=1426 RepID=UPI000B132BBE|nr:DUF4275 family protein [Parageobacillus thermoglucosidasius]
MLFVLSREGRSIYAYQRRNLRTEDLRREHDVCVVDPKFTWTYVQTHEEYLSQKVNLCGKKLRCVHRFFCLCI